MKRQIKAEYNISMIYMEPVSSFHPPSLPSRPEQKVTKLMKRLMKDQTERMRQFSWELTRRLPSPVMSPVNTAFINQDQLNLPPLFASRKLKH
jgi:hypothetical protein